MTESIPHVQGDCEDGAQNSISYLLFPSDSNVEVVPDVSIDQSLLRAAYESKRPATLYFEVTGILRREPRFIADRAVYVTTTLFSELLLSAALVPNFESPRTFINSFVDRTLLDGWLGYFGPYVTTPEEGIGGSDRSICARYLKDDSHVIFHLEREAISETPAAQARVVLTAVPSVLPTLGT